MVSISLLPPPPSSHTNAPHSLSAPIHPSHSLVSGRRSVLCRLNQFASWSQRSHEPLVRGISKHSAPSVLILVSSFCPETTELSVTPTLSRPDPSEIPKPISRTDTLSYTHVLCPSHGGSSTTSSGSDVLGLVLCLACAHLLEGRVSPGGRPSHLLPILLVS